MIEKIRELGKNEDAKGTKKQFIFLDWLPSDFEKTEDIEEAKKKLPVLKNNLLQLQELKWKLSHQVVKEQRTSLLERLRGVRTKEVVKYEPVLFFNSETVLSLCPLDTPVKHYFFTLEEIEARIIATEGFVEIFEKVLEDVTPHEIKKQSVVKYK